MADEHIVDVLDLEQKMVEPASSFFMQKNA